MIIEWRHWHLTLQRLKYSCILKIQSVRNNVLYSHSLVGVKVHILIISLVSLCTFNHLPKTKDTTWSFWASFNLCFECWSCWKKETEILLLKFVAFIQVFSKIIFWKKEKEIEFVYCFKVTIAITFLSSFWQIRKSHQHND